MTRLPLSSARWMMWTAVNVLPAPVGILYHRALVARPERLPQPLEDALLVRAQRTQRALGREQRAHAARLSSSCPEPSALNALSAKTSASRA